MAVFPQNMKLIDPEDTEGSIRELDRYIRYMTEQVEFAMQNTTRTVSAAGVSNVTLYQLLQELANSVSAMQGTVNSISGTVKTLQSKVDSLEKQIEAPEQAEETEEG